MFYDRNYLFFPTNNTFLVETIQPVKIVGIRVKVNFWYTFNPKVVTVTEVFNLPNQKCITRVLIGNQGTEFNQTYVYTCFTKTVDMIDYERHDRILITFSHSVKCSDFNCLGRIQEVELFQIDTDECNEPDQPRYGVSVPITDPSSIRSGRMVNLDGDGENKDMGKEMVTMTSATDRSRIGPPIFFPDGKMNGLFIQYVCKQDFVPDNPKRRFIRRCPVGGSWIGDPNAPLDDRQKPICKPKYKCAIATLKIPPDGSVIANYTDKWSSRESVAEGEVFFSCKEDGYRIDLVKSSRCLRDGTWTDSEPKCVEGDPSDEYATMSMPNQPNSVNKSPRAKSKLQSNNKWLIVGIVAVAVGIIITGGLAYHCLFRKRRFRPEMKPMPSTQLQMTLSQPRFPDGSVIPKRPGIPVPVSLHPATINTQQQSNYLSHDSIHFDHGKRYLSDICSPTYEEINPLTSAAAEEVYQEMDPSMEEEPGYYSGSNDSKRDTDGGRAGTYIQMGAGAGNVILRKH